MPEDRLSGAGVPSSPHASPEDLWPAYYEELHAVARSLMRGEPRSPSLQPTLLLNEAYARVFKDGIPEWRNKSYFIGSMARAMRQYLVDRARRRRVEREAAAQIHAESRGNAATNGALGNAGPASLKDIAAYSMEDAGRAPEVSEALAAAVDDLAKEHPRAATGVELRCAYNLSAAQVAEILGIAERTAKADWTFARAWLAKHLGGLDHPS